MMYYSATGESVVVVVVVWPSISISKWPGPDPSVIISKCISWGKFGPCSQAWAQKTSK